VLRDEAGVDLAALEAGQVQDHGVVDRRRGDAEDDQLRAAARAQRRAPPRLGRCWRTVPCAWPAGTFATSMVAGR